MLLLSLLNNPALLLAWTAAIIIVISIHEFSHAAMSTWLGDPTAERSGRLTLNPLSHLSGFGFLALLLIGFGWGNPVPYNPHNLKYPRFGPALVALAGPLSNFLLAIIFVLAFKFLTAAAIFSPENLLMVFLYLLIRLNIVLMVFNLIPIPPLDGSKILFAFLAHPRYAAVVDFLEEHGPSLLFLLIILDNVIGLNIFSGFLQWFTGLVETWILGA